MMGGRGGKNPWGERAKLYIWKFHTIVDGVSVYKGNSMLAPGGSPPAWFTKEVGQGAIPTIQWYTHFKGVTLSSQNGGQWIVSHQQGNFSTTNSLNDYKLEYGNFTKTEYATNGHPIIYQ